MINTTTTPPIVSPPTGQEIATFSQVDLKPHIGPFSVVLLVIGNAIGSGIFLISGVMLGHMPSASLLILAWIIGGALVLAGALTYAELGAMFPHSGGLYLFLHEAYGPLVAFFFGWASLLVILTGQIGAIAIGFSEYFSYFFPFFSSNNILFVVPFVGHSGLAFTANKLIAVLAIALLGALNYVDAQKSNHLNVVLTVVKIAGISALPAMALFFTRAHPQWHPVVPLHMTGPATLTAFGVAMIAVLWAYDGWQYVPFAAGEMVDAQKNLPRGLILGVAIVIAIFVNVNLAYLYALPAQQMRGLLRVGEASATAMMGINGGRFISAAVLTSAFGCCRAMMLVCTRVFFAMARKGVFPKTFGRVHARYGTPYAAIVLTTIWAILYAVSGSYEQLFTYVMFGGLLFAVLGGAAVFFLRHRLPEQARPYRVWGYPLVPCIFIGGSCLLVVNTLVEKPIESFVGLALIFAGLPAYWYWHVAPQTQKRSLPDIS
ncbi:MAG: amino acid permease [Acidobacteria bacterium]|nr:amino acid permease [Acidobacteriota bacterium]